MGGYSYPGPDLATQLGQGQPNSQGRVLDHARSGYGPFSASDQEYLDQFMTIARPNESYWLTALPWSDPSSDLRADILAMQLADQYEAPIRRWVGLDG